ncbi:uncharacterized protein isoform X2 [Choristoneura fumiferana]
MMEETTLQKTSYQPKTMAELLPDLALKGIMSKDDILTLTGKKKPRHTMATNRTAERAVKPLTMAEMKAEIEGRTPARPKAATSTKKKGWNSSIKVDKKISHTGDGKLHNNVVRKVLNFQPLRPAPPPQTRPTTYTRMTMMPPVPKTRMTMAPAAPPRMTVSAETPKFPKPEHRAKKSLYIQAKTSVRISGICNIPETPEETKPAKPRVAAANKENSSYSANINRKSIAPKLINHKRLLPPSVPDTPLSNDSWKSGSDASFIQKEKEIHDSEEKTNAVLDSYPTLENIAEVSPPVSTPFREYRQNKESLNNSSILENSNVENDTIMCFDKPAASEAVNEREESVIVSLCDMLKKATVNNTETQTSELKEILQIEKQTRHNIKMINDGIQVLINIKETQQKALEDIIKKKGLLIENRDGRHISGSDKDVTLVSNNLPPAEFKSPEKSPVLGRHCSVIRASPKSPSYKIPKKSACLRKKVFYKSMPNVSDMSTPVKIDGGKALNMYLKMKEQLHFLNTPVVKARPAVPDTPAVTSQNLKMQLNKLYDES